MRVIPNNFRQMCLPYHFTEMTAAINERHADDVARAELEYGVELWQFLGRDKIYPRAREHTYLPVNRWYKPLGVNGHAVRFARYLDYPQSFIRFTVDPHTIEGVWFSSGDDDSPWVADASGDRAGALYLYYDNPHSLDTYGERYARLLSYMDSDWRDIRGDRRTRYAMQKAGLVGA